MQMFNCINDNQTIKQIERKTCYNNSIYIKCLHAPKFGEESLQSIKLSHGRVDFSRGLHILYIVSPAMQSMSKPDALVHVERIG